MKKISRFASIVFLTMISSMAIVPLTGCGSSDDLSTVTDGADAEALAEYERLSAATEAEGEDEGDE